MFLVTLGEWAREPIATSLLLAVRFLVACLGCAYAAHGWRRAHRDVISVRGSGRNGPLLVLSEWATRTERARCGMQGAIFSAVVYEMTWARWLMYGLWAGTVPLEIYYANAGVWLFVSGSLMLLSVLELRDRRRLVLSTPSRFAAGLLRLRKLLGFSGDAVVTLKSDETKKKDKA